MTDTVTIKILDEINVAIIGLKVKEYEHFYNKFGFFDDGYIFKPAYKTGRWDGKIRLFTKAGKTSIHFVDDILPDLKAFGYKIRLKDSRVPINYDVPLVNTHTFEEKYNIVLGDHQVETINALLENRGGIAVAATGSGKSYVIGALFNILHEHMKFKCLAIVPSTDLVLQTTAELELFGNDVGLYYGAKKQLNKTHLVSTWQSLQNNPVILSNYHAVIIDEAHGAKSHVLKSMLMDYAPDAHFIAGVTGTLPKHQAHMMQIKYVLGNQIAKVEGSDLIDLGWLAKLKINKLVLEEDLSDTYEAWRKAEPTDSAGVSYKQFKAEYFPDFTAERQWLKTHKPRLSFLSELIMAETRKTGNSFVLVNGVDFGKRLAKSIPGAIFIHGVDDTDVRKKVYDLFSVRDDVVVIATYNLASTGLNIKRIYNMFLLDPGKSFIQIIQSIGRGLRKAVDKDSVTVWDISSDFKYSKKHSAQRKGYYKEQKYKFTEQKIDYIQILESFDSDSDEELDTTKQIAVY